MVQASRQEGYIGSIAEWVNAGCPNDERLVSFGSQARDSEGGLARSSATCTPAIAATRSTTGSSERVLAASVGAGQVPVLIHVAAKHALLPSREVCSTCSGPACIICPESLKGSHQFVDVESSVAIAIEVRDEGLSHLSLIVAAEIGNTVLHSGGDLICTVEPGVVQVVDRVASLPVVQTTVESPAVGLLGPRSTTSALIGPLRLGDSDQQDTKNPHRISKTSHRYTLSGLAGMSCTSLQGRCTRRGATRPAFEL